MDYRSITKAQQLILRVYAIVETEQGILKDLVTVLEEYNKFLASEIEKFGAKHD